MELMAELLAIDNESYEDVKSMEELYEEIRADPLYQRLFELANVHTAERFGLDVPENAYEEMAQAIDDESEWAVVREMDWFASAQTTADEEDFFHWELEFPEVFFGTDGEKKPEAGFDSVVGNPPYVPTEQIPERHKEYLTTKFDTLHRKYDLSVAFLEQCFRLARSHGFTGMITPVAWETGENYEIFREQRIASFEEPSLWKITNLPFDVFADAYIDTNIAIFRIEESDGDFAVKEFEKRDQITDAKSLRHGYEEIPHQYLRDDPGSKIYFRKKHYELLQSYDSEQFRPLGDLTDARQGIVASFFEYSDTKDSEDYLLYRECDVYRYSLSVTDEKYIDFSDEDSLREFYEQPRILLRRLVSRDDRLMAVYVEEPFVVKKDLNPFIRTDTEMSLQYLLTCLNSALLSFLYVSSSALAQKDDFRQTTLSEIRSLPIRKLAVNSPIDEEIENELESLRGSFTREEVVELVSRALLTCEGQRAIHDFLQTLAEDIRNEKDQRTDLNLDLLSYFGSYEWDEPLPELGFYQPAADPDSVLHEATEDNDDHLRLRIGDVRAVREGPNSVEITATARYRPGEDEDFEETEYLPAFRLTDLTEAEADLVEAFVPVASDEAGGFAEFRKKATKNNSLMDRIEAMTLPELDDVADGLERYMETKARAGELDERIETTDELIDEIVYELYGLTDEEIQIVEEAIETGLST